MVPDDVLFESGAGETVRRNLLCNCGIQTQLRLPTGVFYARGRGKRAVLPAWGRRRGGSPRELWIYDLRTNQHFTLKANSLERHHLDDFVACYNTGDRSQRAAGETEQFGWFTDDELVNRDKTNLDIFWLRAESLVDSENVPAPDVIAVEILVELHAALEQLEQITGDLGGEESE